MITSLYNFIFPEPNDPRPKGYTKSKMTAYERSMTFTHCDVCNKDYRFGNYYTHRKTKKHLRNQEKIQNKII